MRHTHRSAKRDPNSAQRDPSSAQRDPSSAQRDGKRTSVRSPARPRKPTHPQAAPPTTRSEVRNQRSPRRSRRSIAQRDGKRTSVRSPARPRKPTHPQAAPPTTLVRSQKSEVASQIAPQHRAARRKTDFSPFPRSTPQAHTPPSGPAHSAPPPPIPPPMAPRLPPPFAPPQRTSAVLRDTPNPTYILQLPRPATYSHCSPSTIPLHPLFTLNDPLVPFPNNHQDAFPFGIRHGFNSRRNFDFTP